MWNCVCVCVYIHAGAQGDWESIGRFLELGFQAVMSCCIWCWDLNSSLLQEQQVLLSIKPSLLSTGSFVFHGSPSFVFTIWIKHIVKTENNQPQTKAKQYLKLPNLFGAYFAFFFASALKFYTNIHASESVTKKKHFFIHANYSADMETKLEKKMSNFGTFLKIFFSYPIFFLLLELLKIEISLEITKKLCFVHIYYQGLVYGGENAYLLMIFFKNLLDPPLSSFPVGGAAGPA